MRDRAGTDVRERQFFLFLPYHIPDIPDQTDAPLALHWEHQEEVRIAEIDVKFVIGHRSLRFDIGDIKKALVGPPWKTDSQGLTHGGPGAVAAGEIGRFEAL